MTASKTILRFFVMLFVTTAGMFYLATASRLSAQKIKLQEETTGQPLLSQTSNTEYIFFESVTKFLVSAISK
jgi:hypothetical protein